MKDLELYIHIPYCVKKCDYCDFLSFSSTKEQRQTYVEALIGEIRSKRTMSDDYQVISIFIGGGTPSILETEQTCQIMEAVYRTFDLAEDVEITTEMNPGTVTKEKLEGYYQLGINRVSIGLQSADNEELKTLGRIHSYEEFLECYRQARQVGYTNINVDLMSAIPGQTYESYMETLQKVVDLEPEHISAYSLIIEEETPFYDRYGEVNSNNSDRELTPLDEYGYSNCAGTSEVTKLPDEDTERRIYRDTLGFLGGKGYERYEISNYAKPGYECRHNLGYWEGREYLGLGLGAASLMKHQRMVNTRDVKMYINGVFQGEVEHLTREMEMEEFCFLGLRKTKGILKTAFKNTFGCDIKLVYGPIIQKFVSNGLLVEDKQSIYLTEQGIDVSNYVMSEFML